MHLFFLTLLILPGLVTMLMKKPVRIMKRFGNQWKDIFSAGQGVGTIHKIQSVEEIVAELKQEYTNALEQLNQKSLLPRK